MRHQHANAPHPLALRLRRERPRHRPAEQGDELATFHSITSSHVAGVDLRQSILIYLSNAITALTLGFPLSSVSSWTLTRITTLGFLARAFAHSRSIISAFSISVSSRFMDILHDKPRRFV
jgi:hypothetical protein